MARISRTAPPTRGPRKARSPSRAAATKPTPGEGDGDRAREKSATPEWYVSYAWGDDKTPEGVARDQAVNELCDKAERQGHKILRDKNVMRVGDRISEFMRRIGAGDRIFVIISDKYLRSSFCMFELSEIWRTSEHEGATFLSRVRAYSLPDAEIGTARKRLQWQVHWKREHDELEAEARLIDPGSLGRDTIRELQWMRSFYSHVGDILATIADVVRPRTIDDLLRYGLDGGESPGSNPAPKAPEPSDPPDPLVAADPAAERRDRSHGQAERKVRKLREIIATMLNASEAAMDALAAEMSPDPASSTALKMEPDEIAGRLMNVPFTVAKNWLTKAHKGLERDGHRDEMTVIEDVSCHLIPFLYVVDRRFDIERLGVNSSDILALPASFPSFAEIVMAGVDARAVEFHRDGFLTIENPWPKARLELEVGPERGRTDAIEQQTRENLCERLGIAELYRQTRNDEKDNAINVRLVYLVRDRNIRFYFIAKVPLIAEESEGFRAIARRIAQRYPELAVIELDPALMNEQVPLFDELRRLFRLLET